MMRTGPNLVILALSTALASALACDDAPRAELEAARAELEMARAELREARAELQEATLRLDETTRESTLARRERLRGERSPTAGGPTATPLPVEKRDPAAEQAHREAAAAAIECVDDGRCTITRAFLEQLLGDPTALSRQARIVPHHQYDAMDGFRIFAIRSGSVPKLLGLRNGDTLTAVNDIVLESMDAALEAYNTIRRSDRLVLKLIRKGEPMVLGIDIVDESGDGDSKKPSPAE